MGGFKRRQDEKRARGWNGQQRICSVVKLCCNCWCRPENWMRWRQLLTARFIRTAVLRAERQTQAERLLGLGKSERERDRVKRSLSVRGNKCTAESGNSSHEQRVWNHRCCKAALQQRERETRVFPYCSVLNAAHHCILNNSTRDHCNTALHTHTQRQQICRDTLHPLKETVETFIMLQTISISSKCCSFDFSVHQRILKTKWSRSPQENIKQLFSTLIIIRNVSWAANQHMSGPQNQS